ITRPDRTQNASATHSRVGKAGSLNLLWAFCQCSREVQTDIPPFLFIPDRGAWPELACPRAQKVDGPLLSLKLHIPYLSQSKVRGQSSLPAEALDTAIIDQLKLDRIAAALNAPLI